MNRRDLLLRGTSLFLFGTGLKTFLSPSIPMSRWEDVEVFTPGVAKKLGLLNKEQPKLFTKEELDPLFKKERDKRDAILFAYAAQRDAFKLKKLRDEYLAIRKSQWFRNIEMLDAEELAKLKISIKDNGFIEPILVNLDNQILHGYRRFKAAQELGLECPTIKVDVPDVNEFRVINASNDSELRSMKDNDYTKWVRDNVPSWSLGNDSDTRATGARTNGVQVPG